MSPTDLADIYQRRFTPDIAYRDSVWRILTRYFQRYVEPSDAVLDLGSGYGQFINNIACGMKFAMDLNPSSRSHVEPGITFLEQDCSQQWQLADDSLNVV